MVLSDLIRRADQTLRDNSPAILTGIGVTGTITTAYLAGKASWTAAEIIRDSVDYGCAPPTFRETVKQRFPHIWKLYIPPVATGALTVVCIISANRIGTARTAAASALLTVSERAFSDYREKVTEKFGEKKEKEVRDEVAQDRVNNAAVPLIIAGSGSVLCYETHTGRYFMCDHETLRRAENLINAQIHREDSASLTDFYDHVGLESTKDSDRVVWTSDKLLTLSFSSVLKSGTPALAFDYNYVRGW